jgi:acetyl esterase
VALDPQARAYLENVAELSEAQQRALTPEQARRTHELSLAGAGVPEPVARVSGLAVPGHHGDIPVRIYTPDAPGPLPGLVYFHGGGWVTGHLGTCDVVLRQVANRAACVVVSVEYRLSPEHRHPVPGDDAEASVRWVAENARLLGIDSKRVIVGGDSAGGTLATVVCIRARDRGGPAIAGQVLIYPVIDHSFNTGSYRDCATGYGLTRAAMEWYWDAYLGPGGDGMDPQASPLRAELWALPPAFLLSCEYDVLRDEGERYAQRLADAGVTVEFLRYEGMIHGFFRLGALFDASRRAVDDVAGFISEL